MNDYTLNLPAVESYDFWGELTVLSDYIPADVECLGLNPAMWQTNQ